MVSAVEWADNHADAVAMNNHDQNQPVVVDHIRDWMAVVLDSPAWVVDNLGGVMMVDIRDCVGMAVGSSDHPVPMVENLVNMVAAEHIYCHRYTWLIWN